MICHKRKLIFIHIPKCAGSSINHYYFNTKNISWKIPNYDVLYGWCPKRKIHMQHATSQQLLETDLISEENWNDYFKFTFVRNPWDRAYSDYLWIMNDRNVKGSFKDFLTKSGPFFEVLNNNNSMNFRGDHLIPQTDFFNLSGEFSLNFIGRFETLQKDILKINTELNINKQFNFHDKKNLNRYSHYSHFYSKSRKKIVNMNYKKDIEILKYQFEEEKRGLKKLKIFF